MGGPINMERKGCYTYYVTFSYDFDLGFWRCFFIIIIRSNYVIRMT